MPFLVNLYNTQLFKIRKVMKEKRGVLKMDTKEEKKAEIKGEIKADKGALKDLKALENKVEAVVKHSEEELKKDQKALKKL